MCLVSTFGLKSRHLQLAAFVAVIGAAVLLPIWRDASPVAGMPRHDGTVISPLGVPQRPLGRVEQHRYLVRLDAIGKPVEAVSEKSGLLPAGLRVGVEETLRRNGTASYRIVDR